MNRKVYGILLILLAVSAVAFSGCTGNAPAETGDSGQSGTAEEKTVYVVGIDGEYPPYSLIDKDGGATGFDVESVQWIADDMGFEVEIKPIAWDGIIPALQAGKIDMVYSGMTITDERLEKVNFSIPYLKINQSVAVHDDNEFTLDQFKAGELIVGAQRGTTGQIWAEENLVNKGLIPAENLKTYDNFPLVIEDLKNKRIDAAIYDRPSMIAAIEEKPIHITGEIDTGEEYGVAIRKDDVALLETINNGLAKLHKDQKWTELKEKYGL
ncbi:ABC transporter substrate-binding protein [Methanoplanus limicola]|uniref:Amino acid ABC transporter substrate-binding protein, PAAT family n=1 Tax=Methanoplanus limicola DSM 2279 TaxID=937775 RepID=H1YYF8_9EURY|nr:ABC transporter substrate-binding protein [Methanoplanus limicola]EHQ35056.1 amino acid ABC transporter substrate-binding protein, PAAT family [Methanoplanus limicola DSM 2279]